MRVMTFNIRFDNEQDEGKNAWVFRRKLITQVIRSYRPSIVGTQEGKWHQLLYLRDRLSEYHLHVSKRVVDDTCQYPTLFFLRKDFHVKEGSEFWLSKTPGVHRSKDWDSMFPRMMSYLKLGSVDGGPGIWVAVTHLDHAGETARYEQAKMLARWVDERNGPVILMGDFNDCPGSEVHHVLTSPQTGLLDTWQALGREEGPGSYTQHGFTGVPHKTRLDWILASTHFTVTNAEIIRYHTGGSYPSDHFPYCADLLLKN